MKKIILLLFILITIMPVIAQQRGTATLGGVVYKQDSGITIEGAIVEAKNGDNVYTDTTGTDGYYFFDNIKAYGISVNYNLTTHATGFFSDTNVVPVSNGDEITQDVYLEEAASIVGTVTLNDESNIYGNVEDVILNLILEGDILQTTNPDPETGFYLFEYLLPGDYTVSALLENFQGQTCQTIIDIAEIDTCNITLNLITGSIKGHISMEEMQLVNSVKVTLNDGEYEINPDAITGFYKFDSINPDTYTIKASLEGYSSDPMNYLDEILQPGDSIINKDFTMNEGFARVFGYITNAEGDSISNATVKAGEEETITNNNGWYEIDNLPIADIIITVSALEYMDNTMNTVLTEGDNSVDFILLHQPKIILGDVPESGFDFGLITVGDVSESESFYVRGNNLQGNLIINSPDPFEISLDDLEYNYEISIPNNSPVTNTTIHIRFKPTDDNPHSELITLTSTNAETISFQVKGEGKSVEPLHVEIISSDDIVCIGDEVLLSASVSGGNDSTYTYEWSDNNIIISTDSTVYVYPFEETEYTLFVTDTITGKSNNDQEVIQIHEAISIVNDPTDKSVCAGESTYFKVSLNNDENITYQWQVNGSDIENNSIYYGVETNELTVNTLYLLNQDIIECNIITQCNDIISESALLTVHRLPIDTIITKGSPPVVLISPDSGLIYQWYQDNEELPGDTNQFYYPTGGFESGSKYHVKIETEFGCITITKPYIVPDVMKSISIYPNPVSSRLIVDVAHLDVDSDLTVVITDIAGRLLISERIDRAKLKANLSLNNLKQGVYIIQIVDDTGSNLFSSKIIKN